MMRSLTGLAARASACWPWGDRRRFRRTGLTVRLAAGKPDNDTQEFMQKPISAFAGDGPYVFVCYAHHDMARVYPDISWLNENHINQRFLNIWYDEGISPGVEWSEELGHALEGSQQVVFFVSQASVNSRHCRDEVHFALSRGIPVVAVYLEDVVLPVGLELSIGSTQAVMAHQFNADEYRARLLT